eukprot:CAMPEP_0172318822 /NCGR_PEP_ID=MMETSP1058-20130122/35897_1 /TAXON_ID=83371 /ORGANISM="Detonula confervacea, Strain CCMP 353" /LENGTH=494 /DNA_ID=CAMNT_0013033727 /DNA_START=87 /DNA_END=1571 /DNA_ORIENTATION=-
MVSNPNSNLVFDFPDPTPHFDFNESPTRTPQNKGGGNSSAPGKKGKRFGKFGSSKSKISGSAGSGSSPSSTSGSLGTVTTTSLNSSLNTSLDHSSPSRNNSPLKPSRNHSGDIAAGPSSHQQQQIGSSSSQSSSLNFTLDPGPTIKLNLPGRPSPLSSHKRNASSSAHSTSGYISEVSEFSFDRVTVATNETGITRDTNVSWGFLDDAVLGGAANVGGGQQISENSFVPYTGSDAGPVVLTNTTAVVSGGKRTITGKGHHAPKISSSTFDNVSLSDEELNIPFTGMVNHDSSNQSVISEISERSAGGPLSGSDEAVNALLREGMESARLKQQGKTSKSARTKAASSLAADGSPSREIHTTAKSSSNNNNNNNDCQQTSTMDQSNNNNLLEDIQTTYTKFKTTRNNGRKEKSSILSSIIEDIQFCGLLFCGIDTTESQEEEGGCDTMKKKKEERKKEADETFLGRVIQCGNEVTCGGGTAFVLPSYTKRGGSMFE